MACRPASNPPHAPGRRAISRPNVARQARLGGSQLRSEALRQPSAAAIRADRSSTRPCSALGAARSACHAAHQRRASRPGTPGHPPPASSRPGLRWGDGGRARPASHAPCRAAWRRPRCGPRGSWWRCRWTSNPASGVATWPGSRSRCARGLASSSGGASDSRGQPRRRPAGALPALRRRPQARFGAHRLPSGSSGDRLTGGEAVCRLLGCSSGAESALHRHARARPWRLGWPPKPPPARRQLPRRAPIARPDPLRDPRQAAPRLRHVPPRPLRRGTIAAPPVGENREGGTRQGGIWKLKSAVSAAALGRAQTLLTPPGPRPSERALRVSSARLASDVQQVYGRTDYARLAADLKQHIIPQSPLFTGEVVVDCVVSGNSGFDAGNLERTESVGLMDGCDLFRAGVVASETTSRGFMRPMTVLNHGPDLLSVFDPRRVLVQVGRKYSESRDERGEYHASRRQTAVG